MVDIYYYSRTGNSEQVAKKIMDQTEGKLYPIKDKNKSFSGIMGWFKGGYYAFKEKEVDISVQLGVNNNLFIITPVWAGKIPPAVRKFMANFDFSNKRIFFIVTMGGREGKSLSILSEFIGQEAELINKLTLKERDISNCDSQLNQICKQI